MRKAFTGTALLLALIGTSALAQTSGIPREFPPEDFAGNQFVDSQGCAFIRAGISGNTQWVPRVDSQRRQLCNYQPTFGAVAEAQAPVEAPLDAAVEAPIETADATPAQDEPELADLPLITIPSASEVAASNSPVRVPIPSRTPVAPAPSPRVIAEAPAATQESVSTDAAAPAVTLAQVCEGKFGPQPGFISSSTGETIDCGPAPAMAAADIVAPVATPAVTEPEPLRMTLAEICEAAKVGDRKFVDASTGEPIVCPSAVQVARAPVAEPEPAPVQTATASVTSACPAIPAAEGQAVRCGPQAKRPWTAANSDGESARARTAGLGLGGTPVPASNPAPGAVAAQPAIPAGYQPVFNDGRHNAQRGLPAAASAAAIGTAQASPYKFVQVGSFGVHSNADNLLARLQAMGLGTASGNSGALKIVAVGPFSSAADLQSALGTVRAMGFPDAFPRN